MSQELIGSKLTGLCLAEDAASDEVQRERLVAGEIERCTVEKRALLSDDRLVWLELSVSTIPSAGPARTAGIVQVQDVTERKRFEEQLRYIADHDSLTGLMNRRRFREELDSQLALRQRYGGDGALLLIDVDRLKAVNDTRGHGVWRHRAAAGRRGDARPLSLDRRPRPPGGRRVRGPAAERRGPRGDGPGERSDLTPRHRRGRLVGGLGIGWRRPVRRAATTRTTEEVMATADAAMYRAKQRGGAVSELAPR